MRYHLNVNGKKISGFFFYDVDFGFYFFTDYYDDLYISDDFANLIISNDELFLDPSNDEYKIYKRIKDNKIAYSFTSVNLKEDVKYYTFNELPLNVKDQEVLSYLADICFLPNGNYVVGTVQNYISVVENIIEKSNDKEFFFRGHYSYKYLLVPSLYRKKKYYENENFMYMDFKTQFYNELSDKKYIEILTTMQHYKMPTRLLDTTSNPLVALYMACDKPSNYKSKGVNIGEVVVMSEDRRNVKYSDSNAVTLLSCLAVLETHYKQEIYEKILESFKKNDPSIYQNSIAFKRFVAEVKSELPVFDFDFFSPDVLLYPRHVKVGMINERIIAQSGSFIIFGLCDYKTENYIKLNTVQNNRVFIVNRENISKQLTMLNINESTMYPDKDHMSSTITKTYE